VQNLFLCGFLFRHSDKPFFHPDFKGLNADTSAGSKIRVAFGYNAIKIIF